MAFFVISEESRGFELLAHAETAAGASIMAAHYRAADQVAPERVRVINGASLAALDALGTCYGAEATPSGQAAAEELLDALAPLYAVNSLETCAEGFERLRYNSEFILLAYPDKDSTAADIGTQWREDVASRDAGERNAATLATVGVLWALANAATLEAEARQLDLEAAGYRFDFERLSGTGLLVRQSDGATACRYTGEDAERLRGATAEELEAEAAESEFSDADSSAVFRLYVEQKESAL